MKRAVAFGPETSQTLLEMSKRSDRATSDVARVSRSSDAGAPIVIRNESGEAIPAYACMKMIGAELDPGTDRYVITVSKPDGIGAPFLFNGSSEVEIGGYGLGYSEIVRALCTDQITPTFGQYWGPIDGWALEPTGSPAILAYGNIENDLLFGMVLKGNPVRVKVKPTQPVDSGNSVRCTIYQSQAPGQAPTATTQEIPAVWLDWESGGEGISAGKEATAEFQPIDGVWRFVSAECETDSEPASKGTTDLASATPGVDSTAAFHINADGVFLNDGAGTFTNVAAPAP